MWLRERAIGGFYLVGVQGGAGAWMASGINFGAGVEPTTWLGNVIRNGLRPIPRYDIRAWDLGGDRQLAVVRVDPVPESPCMTTSGEVFERVSGETVKVVDPAILARLFDRGNRAVRDAEAAALQAASVGLDAAHAPPFLFLVLVFAPIGKPDDIGGRLFTRDFARRLRDVVRGLPTEPLFPGWGAEQYESYVTQNAIVAARVGEDARQIWRVRAAWDASVAVHFQLYPRAEHEGRAFADAAFEEVIAPAKEAGATLVEALDGYGRAHVALTWRAQGFELHHEHVGRSMPDEPPFPIRRWTADDGRLDGRLSESMKRELLRACRFEVWEPAEETSEVER